MSLRVYNTLSKQKELFNPIRAGHVGMYLCGPTVYKPPHIGHMVGPVIFDAIKRYLRFKGYEVIWVVNITDVDDKLIEAAAKQGCSVQELADRNTVLYMECLALLGIDGIDRFPKASEHISEIVELCQRLIASSHAYVVEGSVYFDVTSDKEYGKLSNRKLEDQESGVRAIESTGKRNAADFALWKAAKENEPRWDSPWGPGRPGWHIECSAMSMKYLGESFDIHGGGMDLLFPHHENELAQSEAATGKPFVRYWLHNGLTRIRTKLPGGQWADEKMSGSLGNVVSARELVERHGSDLIRYLLLSTQYRRPIEFTDDAITAVRKAHAVFGRLVERVRLLGGGEAVETGPGIDAIAAGLLDSQISDFVRAVLGFQMKFLEMMDDDFNTAGAIAVLHELAGQINAFIELHHVEQNQQPQMVQAAGAATHTVVRLGRVLGLFSQRPQAAEVKDPTALNQVMNVIMELRQDLRKQKQFALADGLRDKLAAIGITLEDRPQGTVWKKE